MHSRCMHHPASPCVSAAGVCDDMRAVIMLVRVCFFSVCLSVLAFARGGGGDSISIIISRSPEKQEKASTGCAVENGHDSFPGTPSRDDRRRRRRKKRRATTRTTTTSCCQGMRWVGTNNHVVLVLDGDIAESAGQDRRKQRVVGRADSAR